jgi:AcrR family transcriptional regulator
MQPQGDWLMVLREEVEAHEQSMRRLIHSAREHGATVQHVADALGLSRSQVYRRYLKS